MYEISQDSQLKRLLDYIRKINPDFRYVISSDDPSEISIQKIIKLFNTGLRSDGYNQEKQRYENIISKNLPKFEKIYTQRGKTSFTSMLGGKYSFVSSQNDYHYEFMYLILIAEATRQRMLERKYAPFSFVENFHQHDSNDNRLFYRMCIDIDAKGFRPQPQHIKIIAERVLAIYKTYYTTENPSSFYVVSRNLGKQDNVHIVFPKLFVEADIMKKITKDLKKNVGQTSSDEEELPQAVLDGIDDNVSGLRTIFSYKLARETDEQGIEKVRYNYKSIYYPQEFLKWCSYKSQYVVDYSMISFENILKALFMHSTIPFCMSTLPERIVSLEEELTVKSSTAHLEINSVIDREAESLTEEFIQDKNLLIHKIEDNRIILKNTGGYHCPVCDRTHEAENPIIFCLGNKLFFNCRRSEENKSFCIGTLEQSEEQKEEHKKNSYKAIIKAECSLRSDDKYNYTEGDFQTVPQDIYMSQHNTVFIRSPMGTQKSYQTRLFLSNYKPKSALWLSSRQKYTESELASLKRDTGLPFKSYKDKKLTDKNFLISQVESLHRFYEQEYEVLILDEVCSLLAQFNSPFHKDNIGLNQDFFEYIVRDSKKVLILDANLSPFEVNLIRSLRPEAKRDDILVFNNTVKLDRELVIYNAEDVFQNKILEDLSLGKKIGISCCSLKKAQYLNALIKEAYPVLDVQLFCSETDKNITESFYCDVLIYTSTLGLGIDIDEQHYDAIYQYATTELSIRSLEQCLGRIRNPKENTVHLYINSKSSFDYFPTDFKKIIQILEDNSESLKSVAKRLITQRLLKMSYKNNRKFTIDRKSPWTWNTIRQISEQNLSKRNIKDLYPLWLENKGYEIKYDENESDKTILTEIKKKEKEIQKEIFMEKFEETSDVAPEKDLLDKQELTAIEKFQLRRCYYRSIVKNPDVNPTQPDEFFKDYHNLDKLRRVKILTAPNPDAVISKSAEKQLDKSSAKDDFNKTYLIKDFLSKTKLVSVEYLINNKPVLSQEDLLEISKQFTSEHEKAFPVMKRCKSKDWLRGKYITQHVLSEIGFTLRTKDKTYNNELRKNICTYELAWNQGTPLEKIVDVIQKKPKIVITKKL
jgi:hypothetical protein